MRRTLREVTDPEEINHFLKQGRVMRLGLVEDGYAYVVPVNYGFEEENGVRYLYFHGANEGKKYNLLQQQPQITFELDQDMELVTSTIACGYGMLFQSVIGKGTVEFLETEEDIRKAIDILLGQYDAPAGLPIAPEVLKRTFLARIRVTELTCKSRTS